MLLFAVITLLVLFGGVLMLLCVPLCIEYQHFPICLRLRYMGFTVLLRYDERLRISVDFLRRKEWAIPKPKAPGPNNSAKPSKARQQSPTQEQPPTQDHFGKGRSGAVHKPSDFSARHRIQLVRYALRLKIPQKIIFALFAFMRRVLGSFSLVQLDCAISLEDFYLQGIIDGIVRGLPPEPRIRLQTNFPAENYCLACVQVRLYALLWAGVVLLCSLPWLGLVQTLIRYRKIRKEAQKTAVGL